jgi:hypothetical protein
MCTVTVHSNFTLDTCGGETTAQIFLSIHQIFCPAKAVSPSTQKRSFLAECALEYHCPMFVVTMGLDMKGFQKVQTSMLFIGSHG